MGQMFVQVDAFTDRAFSGNPAVVCLLPASAEAAWMQAIAREMKAEAAFLVRRADGAFDLRWFVPAGESDICGHATLASAHLLWQDGHLPEDERALFHTSAGRLTADRSDEGIVLDFPAAPASPVGEPPGLADALGVPVRAVARSRFNLLAEVGSEVAVRDLAPNLHALQLPPVIVTSRSRSPDYDFVSRFFAPGSGIDEDPVTGSAHCTLGPYWQPRLGKDHLVGYQASARGGVVRVHVAGERALLIGRAVAVLRGELLGAAAPEFAGATQT